MGNEDFINDLQEMIKYLTPEGTRIEFFGSILTDHFKPGISDLDLVVEGDLTPRAKGEIIFLVRQADKEYGLRLSESPYLHPVPIYIDGLPGQLLLSLFYGRLGPLMKFLTGFLTKRWKVNKRKGSFTLGEYWDGRPVKLWDSRIIGTWLWS